MRVYLRRHKIFSKNVDAIGKRFSNIGTFRCAATPKITRLRNNYEGIIERIDEFVGSELRTLRSVLYSCIFRYGFMVCFVRYLIDCGMFTSRLQLIYE